MIAILLLGRHWPLTITVMARTCDMLDILLINNNLSFCLESLPRYVDMITKVTVVIKCVRTQSVAHEYSATRLIA